MGDAPAAAENPIPSGLTVLVSARSFLFVPGDQRARLDRCRERGADAVIIDLEDAVTPDRRDHALAIVAEWLAEQGAEGSDIWVRVSSVADTASQVAALPQERLAGIVIPKIRSAEELDLLPPSPPVIGFIETAAAVLDVAAIARAEPVVRLVIGEADLGADLGLDPRGSGPAWPSLRTQVVVASAAAGLDQPLAPVHPDFTNLDAYRRGSEELQAAGYGGRACIHPAQVEIVNQVFTPSSEEVARAMRLVARYAEAVAAGDGVIVVDDGTMVDEAYVRTARRTLDRGRRAGMVLD
ncbi:MAG: HpcH/HpaI aldolase/citrate lyase family protein [Acidimicrobiia bacterium]